jgi:multidrug efflux pump subunit AcrB
MAFGEGAEMLQPLAVTIVAGLSFSTLVSLLLVPLVYDLFASGLIRGQQFQMCGPPG